MRNNVGKDLLRQRDKYPFSNEQMEQTNESFRDRSEV